jgi:hypothetical protein
VSRYGWNGRHRALKPPGFDQAWGFDSLYRHYGRKHKECRSPAKTLTVERPGRVRFPLLPLRAPTQFVAVGGCGALSFRVRLTAGRLALTQEVVVRIHDPKLNAGSSKGRTGDFESPYLGSNPSPAASTNRQRRSLCSRRLNHA